jgi:hypothetical protein
MSRSKQKGTAFETLVLGAFREAYPYAERRAMNGKLDKGDLNLPGEDLYIVECKAVTRFNLPEWKREAEQEAANAGVRVGVVVHKRRGNANPWDQWVTMTVFDLLYLVSDGALDEAAVRKALASDRANS